MKNPEAYSYNILSSSTVIHGGYTPSTHPSAVNTSKLVTITLSTLSQPGHWFLFITDKANNRCSEQNQFFYKTKKIKSMAGLRILNITPLHDREL